MFYIAKIDADNFNTPSAVYLRKSMAIAIEVAFEMAIESGLNRSSQLREEIKTNGYCQCGNITIAWGSTTE